MDLEYLGDSSCVAAAGYKAGYLTVQFQDGTMYTYSGVHPFTWGNFMRSGSKGYFFNKNIRNNYPNFIGPPPEGALIDKASEMLDKILGPEYFEE